MRFKKITLDNAVKGGAVSEECMEIEVQVGDVVFKISENDNKLQVRVDKELVVIPKANNAISLTQND